MPAEILTVEQVEERLLLLIHSLSLCDEVYQLNKIRRQIDDLLYMYCRALGHGLLVADGYLPVDYRPRCKRGGCDAGGNNDCN